MACAKKVIYVTECKSRETGTWEPCLAWTSRSAARKAVKLDKTYLKRNKAEEYCDIRVGRYIREGK